jgi:hypothetical protein
MAAHAIGYITSALASGLSGESRQVFRYGDYLIQFSPYAGTYLYYSVSSNGGTSFGSWTAITAANARYPAGHMDADGNIFLVFTSFSSYWNVYYVKFTWNGSGWTKGTTYLVASNIYGTGQLVDQVAVTQRSNGDIWVGYIKQNYDFKILTNPNEDGSGTWTANDPTASNCYGIALMPVGTDIWALYVSGGKLTYKIYSSSWSSATDIAASGITNDFFSTLKVGDSDIWGAVRTTGGIKVYHYTGSWDSGNLDGTGNGGDLHVTLGITSGTNIILVFYYPNDLRYRLYRGGVWGSLVQPYSTSASEIYPTVINNPPSGKVQFTFQKLVDNQLYLDEVTLPVTTQTTINSNSNIKGTIQHTTQADAKIIVARELKTVLSNAVVKAIKIITINSDTNIKGTVQQTILSDAKISKKQQAIINSNSTIKQIETTTINSNANIKGTLQQEIIGDAKIVTREQSTILADSSIKHIEDNQILSDSKVVYRILKTRIADATIKAVKYFYGQIQARVESSKTFNAQLQAAYPTPVNPTALIATDPKLGDAIFLTWTGSSDNVGYNVYKDVGGSWIKQNATLIYDYQTTIGELVTGLTYNFKVVGVNGEGLESAGATASGTPTFDIQYRTNPTYEIRIGGIVYTGYILDSIEIVYGPSFCTASFHKNIRPTEEALLATGQSVYIKINGRYVFGGYLFKREDVWSGGALQVNFTVIGFSYYYSTFCREQPWPPEKKKYISKFDEDSLVGNTELEARAAIAAYHGAVLYSSPITGGLWEYRYGHPICRRTYTIGQNILEENLINDKTNQIRSVTAVSDFSQYTEINSLRILDSNKGDLNLFKTTAPNRALYSFPLHEEVPSPKNTSFGTIPAPFKTKDDIKGFYFSLNLGGFQSEISNVKVQALTNSAPKITKLLQIMEEVPALSEYGTDYGFTEWITTGNVEFTPMDLLEKRYNRIDPVTEEEVSVAHPWRDGSFSSKPAIVSYETYPLEWQDVSASVDYSHDETGKTAYIVINSVPVRYEAQILRGTLEREIFDATTADLTTEHLDVAYEEDPDQYIASMRVLYTYKGKRYSYTVGSGAPKRYIVQGITPIFNEEDEEYGLPGDNLDEVMETLEDAANTEFHKSDLPLREGSLQILGDETLDLRTTVNGLDVVRIRHSFNDGFRTSLELSIPQSEYASTLHILIKDKERKRENEVLKPTVSTLAYDVDKIKSLFGKSVQVAETSVKPDSSLSTYA